MITDDIVIREVEKGSGDISIMANEHDVTITDLQHYNDNSITLTRKEWKKVLPKLLEIVIE